MNLEQVVGRVFKDVLDVPEITPEESDYWEQWTRENLGNLLEILPYNNQQFDIDAYMQYLSENVINGIFNEEDDEDTKETFKSSLETAFSQLPRDRAPTTIDVKKFIESSEDAHITSLFLIYAYHLRRLKHRADEVRSIEIPDAPPLPPPVTNLPVLDISKMGIEEENAREAKRNLFVNHLRVFASHKINWSHDDRKRALADLESKWQTLDKFSQRDLRTLYDVFKHDYGPI